MSPGGRTWNTVWITGASSGIGLELAKLLDGEVAHIAVSARSADRLEALAAAGETIVPYPVDVSDAAAIAECARAIEDAAGPIDLAVLNAGLWRMMDVAELDVAAVRAGFEVNYMGVIHGIAAILPAMLARGGGHIAIVASVAGYRGLPRSVAYGPTKAALINLAETLRAELEPRGITVSLVNPGFVDTPMTASGHAKNAVRASRIDATPLGVFGEPYDIAMGCVYLASDESRWVTGTELVIDGGMTAV